MNSDSSIELALEGGPSFMAYINELNNNCNKSSTNNSDPQPNFFPRVKFVEEVKYEESKHNFGSASSRQPH